MYTNMDKHDIMWTWKRYTNPNSLPGSLACQLKRFSDGIKKVSWSQVGHRQIGAFILTHSTSNTCTREAQVSQKREFSDEHKKKLSEAAHKRWANPEQRAKKSAHMKKLHAETDLRERVSKATKEAMARPEVVEKGRLGKERSRAYELELRASPEYRTRKSAKSREVGSNPEYKAKMSISTKAAHARPETKAKLKAIMDEIRLRPEYHEKLSKSIKEFWSDDERREERLEAIFAGQKYTGTTIELIVQSILEDTNTPYEPQKFIGGFSVDFYVPALRLVIECDGDYWHSRPGVKERDARKDEYLTQKGYKILRLAEHQIRKNDLANLHELLAQERK